MANAITNELKRQIFSQESEDPFLTLVTLTHTTFTARLVNNSSDITSNGFVFTAFPMKVKMPADDGETARDFAIEFDNVSLDLITSMRSVDGDIGVRIDMILSSLPDVIQISNEDLVIRSVTYDKTKLTARIILDNFLTTAMTSERYTPSLYPGLF